MADRTAAALIRPARAGRNLLSLDRRWNRMFISPEQYRRLPVLAIGLR
jgi:hypothetical protein